MTIFNSVWPSLLLLSTLWTILAITFFYVRNQIKKEKAQLYLDPELIKQNFNDKKAFQKEIDELALYVSRLPRSEDILKEYRETENNEQ